MERVQLLERMAAARAKLDLMRVRQRTLGEDELRLLLEALGEIANLPLHIDDAALQTPPMLRNAAQRFRAEHGDLGPIVVDYVQLMQAPEYKDNRVQEVSTISRGLKLLAKELDCPVIALSQLSRAVESRQSKIPLLSDLRESGSLEQDADLVLFIYREELYDGETDKKGIAELHVAKHRGGPLGVIPVRFEAATTSFQDLTPRASWNTGR